MKPGREIFGAFQAGQLERFTCPVAPHLGPRSYFLPQSFDRLLSTSPLELMLAAPGVALSAVVVSTQRIAVQGRSLRLQWIR